MRRKLDNYPTPQRATELLLQHIDITGCSIYEPCVGDGAIYKVLLTKPTYNIWTNDINEKVDATWHVDARKDILVHQFNWIITNPPFLWSYEILQNYWYPQTQFAFLLRLSFLEPTEQRRQFLEKHPPSGLIIMSRISFTGDGKTDNVTAAWFLWNTKPMGVIIKSLK